jgi:hypothetical protein
MKLKVNLILTALILTLIFYSCGKETQSSTQGGGLFKIRYTITPQLDFGYVNNYNNIFQTFNNIQGLTGLNIMWVGGQQSSPLSTIETIELSTTKGQNISTNTFLTNSINRICHTVKIEGIINGKVFQTFSKEYGTTGTGLNAVNCKDQGQTAVNFIIP